MRTNVLRSILFTGRGVGLGACLLGAGLSLAAGGCKWTDFDDLEEDTWVTATPKPDNGAANWGVAISRLTRSGSGATLAVLGATTATYNDLAIGPSGDVNTTTENELNTNFAIGPLALEPLLLTRPDADEVALVTGLEVNRIIVVRAVNGELSSVPVTGLAQPSGATYLVAPPRGASEMPQMQIMVAQADAVYGAFFASPPTQVSKCALRDEAGMVISIRALGAYRPDGALSDDVLVLTEAGKLLAYPGAVFNGCGAMTQGPTTGMVRDLMFAGVQTGSQIHVFTDGTATYALVQIHNDTGKGKLGLYKISAASIDEVGAARDIDRLRTVALYQPSTDGKRYVLAGMPTATVEGVDAGQVQVRELDLTTGVAEAPAMTLFDAQPEAKQSFGRSVAALPFNGKNIIAVAADNEVFLYFRTTMYAETREGR
jgi:hypothetical protein